MPFNITQLQALRPYLFHLTSAQNLANIKTNKALDPAELLARTAGRPDVIQKRRKSHVTLAVQGKRVTLRDQAPLHVRNMLLDPGWTFERFLQSLNARVFFWPGTSSGPIDYGIRHFRKYEAEKPVLLRMSLQSFVSFNQTVALEFCRFNSGSPRWSKERPAPRGESTFVNCLVAPFAARDVVEVTAPARVSLPQDTEVGDAPNGPWAPLFDP